MAIVFQKDSRSNITYAYESQAYWCKDKKQSRAKRKLIGKLDEQTGKIVPTDGRCRKEKNVDKQNYSRLFYGSTYLLDQIGEKIGLTADLKQCFPDTYQQILSIVYYLVLENESPLYRFEKWSQLHKHPYNKNITSQQSSKIFSSISENQRMLFLRLQTSRRMNEEYWAYDTTSISSYSECLKQVKYGYNKENDKLPQLNLAIVFGEESNLPFYYRQLPGNITDNKTVDHLLKSLNSLDLNKINLVMDKGFYSKKNIDYLINNNTRFIIGLKMSLQTTRGHLNGIYHNFKNADNFDVDYDLYLQRVKIKDDLYIHYYYNTEQAAESEKNLDKKILNLKKEFNVKTYDKKIYDQYFTIENDSIVINQDKVNKIKKYYGFFALMTNDDISSTKALEIYRNKDLAEKAFGDLKTRLNLRRHLVSSEQSLNGKLFIQFVALIYISYIKKQMQNEKLFKDYTLNEVLDILDLIEIFEAKNQKSYLGEITKKQIELYKALDVKQPLSL